jgi:hypothetical protein
MRGHYPKLLVVAACGAALAVSVDWLSVSVATLTRVALTTADTATVTRELQNVAIAPEPLEELPDSANVSLVLLKASAKRSDIDVLFDCEARIDNATGSELKVKSNFFSAFDGLEIVITSKEGESLAQVGYTRHQSPLSLPPGRDFVLKKGSTSKILTFPLHELARDVKRVKVRLVGKLRGSPYTRSLSTENLEVDIDE